MTTRARAGMTLIELVVGVVITGLMAAAGAAAFGTIVDNRRVIVESTAELERASALREMLRNWIGSGTVQVQTQQVRARTTRAAQVRGGAMQNTTQPAITSAVSTGDELRFTTSALTPAMAPYVNMRLFVDGDAATLEQGLSIEYQVTPQAPLQRRQLDSSIVRMTVEYLDRTTNRWVPSADAGAIRMAAVRLTFPGDSVEVPRLLQLPMVFSQSLVASQPGGSESLGEEDGLGGGIGGGGRGGGDGGRGGGGIRGGGGGGAAGPGRPGAGARPPTGRPGGRGVP